MITPFLAQRLLSETVFASYVVSRSLRAGRGQCAVGAQAVPQNAKVVVLNGPPGNLHADTRRLAWQKEFFDKRADVKIVGEQIAHWNKEEAMRYMEDWVQANPQIDAIISMNDNMAAGALEVVKDDPRFKNLLAYGVDGTAEAMLLIQSGRMTSRRCKTPMFWRRRTSASPTIF